MTGNDHRPTPIYNRPGLEQLAYRIGDYGRFRQRLLAALTSTLRPLKGDAPLAKLTTRDPSDPAIALLDAWAVVADVLTFYQERIANEGFLRTATERLSVLELARTIGYELDPGVAASTYLSFKVEDAPGSPTVVPVPARTQIMSVPLKDELPQIFETVEDFTAYLAWNGLRPRPTRPQKVYPDTRQLYLAGTSTQLQPGNLLLLVDDVPERQTYLLPLHTVTPDQAAGYTLVQWRQSIPPVQTPLRRPQLFAFRTQAHLFGYNAPNWETMPPEVKLAAIAKGGSTIQGGVFRSATDGITWTPASQGLPSSDIQCLAAQGNLVLAGTPDKGLFRSTDNGQTWTAANAGITSTNILTLHISAQNTVFNGAIFAGTPNGGVFRSKDQGKNWVAISQGAVRSKQISNDEWEPINTSLPNTVVRSLLTYDSEDTGLIGTFEINDQTVTDAGDAAPLNESLNVNDVVCLTLGSFSQRRRIINTPTSNSFEIDEAFKLPEGTSYSATVTVTFTLEGEEQTDRLTISSGTISSNGNHIVGEGTQFNDLLDFQREVSSREGVANAEISEIIIEFLEESFPVDENSEGFRIESDTSLFIGPTQVQVFRVTSYMLVGTDQGVYRAAIKADNDQGRSWYLKAGTDARTIFALEHISGHRVVAGTDDGLLTSDNNGASWNREWNSSLFENRKILSLCHYDNAAGSFLFVGTDKGIYRYTISASSWANISNDGESGSAILVNRLIASITTDERGDTRYLFAATDAGIFVSLNSGDNSGDVTWQQISQDVVPQTVIALALDDTLDDSAKALFAGTKFDNFLPIEAEANSESSNLETNGATAGIQPQKQEWPDFEIQNPRQLDLDTLYPQILPQSWVVLVDDRDPNDPEQQAEPRYGVRRVDSVATVDRQDFGLSGKLSRLELGVAVEPDRFGLRSARVLGQSTELVLAPEPLTVSDRQQNIFADPILDDTVYLQAFVQNLQPNQVVMVNGKHMRMRLSDVGGVLRSRHDWQPLNTGLKDLTLNALQKTATGVLLAATNAGLYRLPNSDERLPDFEATWAAVALLRFKAVHSLFEGSFEEPSERPNFLLVGADLGLYRAEPSDDSLIKVALPMEATVLAFHACQTSSDATVNIDNISGITVKTSNTIDPSVLKVGTVVRAAGQTRIVTGVNTGNQTFLINEIFDPAPIQSEDPRVFDPLAIGGTFWLAGTDRGILRSTDAGQTWEQLKALQGRTIHSLLSRLNDSALEIFAGTDQGLYYSVNSGQSWQKQSEQQDAVVYSLTKRLDQGDITVWVGTDKGIYRLEADLEAELPGLEGLSDRCILSLQFDNPGLYAGTDQGIYHSANGEDIWESLDAGLAPASGRALLVQGEHLLVGTEQGIWVTPASGQRSEPQQDPVNWSRSNTGIVNAQVLSLASSPDATTLLAGTTAGLYRSTSGGRTWIPFDDHLDQANAPGKLKIQTVLHSQRSQRGYWFVGTPEGVFVRESQPEQPNSDRWQLVGDNTLPYSNIQAIVEQDNWLLAGTLSGGLFKLDLSNFDPKTPEGTAQKQGWQPAGLNNTDVHAIATYLSHIYVGTHRDGIFHSSDHGVTWRRITDQRTGRGTLTSDGSQVTWSGAVTGLLQPGDVINANGQSRTILAIQDSEQPVTFTVDAPFRPNLPANTEFTINTGLTNRDITTLQLSADGSVLYAGTAGSGVFRSGDEGDRWQQIITNLEDLSIRCLICEGNETVWVGTATAGVFRSINRGDLWSAASLNLTNTDVRALLLPHNSTLVAGGIGILKSEDGLTVKPVQRQDIVQVIKPPQPQPPQPNQPLTDYRWLLRDKDDFLGLLDTTAEQIFPLLPAADTDALMSEQAQIKYPPTDQQQPILTLQAPITYSYDPATVEIAANVVKATHGETAAEILGSGDGTTANQRFALTKPPLTYVATTNARGSDSTLEVRVDDVLWQEVASLYSLKPQSQAYIIRIEDDGTTTITFGDGERGARPPSGQENITARYRSGIGTDGNVAAQRLTILKTRPQGIADVTNSLPATGAANRESLAAARTNAPPTARTLGRIVSLTDFQDFAQGFVGIGKAQAVALWDGNTQVVHITIAGADAAPVPPTAALYQSLVTAIDQARDPIQQVQVDSYERLFFNLEARVLLDPRYQAATVLPQLTAVLTTSFAFERRDFGQFVTSAEVITALQSVTGVIAVDLDALYAVGRSRALNAVLTAHTARYDPDTQTIQPAQLFLLSPTGIQLSFVATL